MNFISFLFHEQLCDSVITQQHEAGTLSAFQSSLFNLSTLLFLIASVLTNHNILYF